MNLRFLSCFFLFLRLTADGQSIFNDKLPLDHIDWEQPVFTKISDSEIHQFLSFKGAEYNSEDEFLPRFSEKVYVSDNEQAYTTTILNASYVPLLESEVAILKKSSKITDEIQVQTKIVSVKKHQFGITSFIPIRKNSITGKYEKLTSFDLSINHSTSVKSQNRSVQTYASHSVLQSGKWYKIAIANDGIYKLSYSFLASMGINMTTINPQNIKIYGNGGGMLPELNSTAHLDDLVENAVYVQGENDGVFNVNDYVLFYGKGPNKWVQNSSSCPTFVHQLNLYSDSAYYFITTDQGLGKRIQSQASSVLPATNIVSSFDDYAFHENENTNFLKSGRDWFGEYFENIASYNFAFSFPNIDVNAAAKIKASIASRYTPSSANYSISSQSGSASLSIALTSGTSYDPYANVGSTCFSFIPTSSAVNVNVTKQTADAVAWLNYLEVNVRRQLIMSGNQMAFRDINSVGVNNVAQYSVFSTSPVQVWDVSDPSNVFLQTTNVSGSDYQFTLPSDVLKEFVAFTGSSYNTPSASGIVPNQDLHALLDKDFLIVAHPDFYDEAMQLASYHETKDGLTAVVVTPQQIYNEFSSGAQDIAAIRNFVKMFYDRASNVNELPQYLLLFGDGSYDNKKRFVNNTNFIPTFQSKNSTTLTLSYVSDDFYGCLDNNEGLISDNNNSDAVDIGIGRFPVKSKAEASAALNKIFNYTKTGVPPTTAINGCSSQLSNSPFGDWRNTLCFIGDDEDGDLHEIQSNQLATMVDTANDNYNVDKIFLDAYPQEATPGGNRYPGATDAINKRVEKGALIVNYTGHGGEVGLAHERVVEVSDINRWDNINNMPLFFTATCEFSRWDDPERTSAGELVFLNPKGGGIALFTTVRLVYATPNFTLNQDFYKSVFVPINGRMPRLGDLYQYMKIRPSGYGTNGRNFTLIGDPALTLAYPTDSISTDSINSIAVSSVSTDTLKALSLVTISGKVRSKNGSVLNTYNGVVYPTVYDKPQSVTTLSNDGAASPPFTFKLQKNILYKGKVSVTNGNFKFTFVIPKDIAYQFGVGRISYYAENGNEDASGNYEKVIIGGANNSAATDVAGPEVNLFMNDTKFVFGGLTNENPNLFATLKDENGVNTVGSGIGHDITAVLDANTERVVVLNDYYQANLNSYKSGTVCYPYSDLSEGKHTLTLKVWDVYNNSSQSYTEFVVAKSAVLALRHVLNYPNPFTTKTQFYFEQNQSGQMLDVQVQIFTIGGKLVKNIDQFMHTDGFRSDPIEWDGRDDFGDKIGKGVYIYRIKVKTGEGSTAEKYEKLVILN
jgi:hypothetical protein